MSGARGPVRGAGGRAVLTGKNPGRGGRLGLATGRAAGRLGGLMTQEQDNTTTMFETTNGVLDTNAAHWQPIPAFADAVARAETGTVAIREKSGDQVPTGDVDVKAAAKLDLEEKTLVIADQLAALAAKTQDHNLAAKVDLNKSQLDRMPDSDLLVAARGVAEAAAANSAALAADYLITAAMLSDLGTAITKFDGLKTAPRDAIVNRKVATLSLPEAVAFVRGIYRNELDKMMTRFKKTAPDFFLAYTAARVIVDRPATLAKKPAPAVAASAGGAAAAK